MTKRKTPRQRRHALSDRLPFHDSTVGQAMFGAERIGVRVPVQNDWPLARYVPRARITDARKILAEQAQRQHEILAECKAGTMTADDATAALRDNDRKALAAIEALEARG